jgi:hypothetical protein
VSLQYDPYTASVFLRPLRCSRPARVWTAAAVLVALAVLACALSGTLDGGSYSRWTDLRELVDAGPQHVARSDTQVPLLRDTCSVVLLVSIGLALLCLYYQWRALAGVVEELVGSGAWKWRSQVDPPSSMLARLMTRAVDASPQATDCRLKMEYLLARYGAADPRRACVSAIAAVGLGLLAWAYVNWTEVWAHVVSAGRSGTPTAVEADWWASSAHVHGLVVYVTVSALGVYFIIAQNATALAAIKAFAAARRLTDFHVDWLDLDGAWGWSAFQRVFLFTYISIALRAVQITALLVGLRIHQLWAVASVAALWVVFLVLYLWYPYRALAAALEPLREARLKALKKEFDQQHLSLAHPSTKTAVFVVEIERVRCANLNPMQLGGWQSWSFVLVVLLPIALTVLQVFAS